MNNTLLDIIFSPINMALSILLIVIFLYWIITMIFGVDFDLDFDVDVDVDVDMDVDLESGLNTDGMSLDDVANAEIKKENIIKDRQKKLKWWQIVLVYFNFVSLPFMFTFTFWILSWWFLTVFFTYLTGSYNNAFGFVIFVGAILPSLILTKILTSPFKSFFKNFNKNGVDSLELLGRTATTVSQINGDRIGSVKIVIDSSPITIYAKSLNGELIKADENVLIIKKSADKKYYYIQSYQIN